MSARDVLPPRASRRLRRPARTPTPSGGGTQVPLSSIRGCGARPSAPGRAYSPCSPAAVIASGQLPKRSTTIKGQRIVHRYRAPLLIGEIAQRFDDHLAPPVHTPTWAKFNAGRLERGAEGSEVLAHGCLRAECCAALAWWRHRMASRTHFASTSARGRSFRSTPALGWGVDSAPRGRGGLGDGSSAQERRRLIW